MLTITALSASAAGSVSAFGSGVPTRPVERSLQLTKGQAVATQIVAPVGSNGYVDLGVTGASVQLVGDLSGYIVGGGQLDWSAHASDPSPGELNATSCATTTFCVAVDQTHAVVVTAGNAVIDNIDPQGRLALGGLLRIVLVLHGRRQHGTRGELFRGTWSLPVDVDGLEYLTSVSCSGTSCMAVDDAGNAFTYAGGTLVVVDARRTGFVVELGVVRAASHVLRHRRQVRHRLHGRRWESGQCISTGLEGLISVSCATAAFCAAVQPASVGDATIFNAGSWTVSTRFRSGWPAGLGVLHLEHVLHGRRCNRRRRRVWREWLDDTDTSSACRRIRRIRFGFVCERTRMCGSCAWIG